MIIYALYKHPRTNSPGPHPRKIKPGPGKTEPTQTHGNERVLIYRVGGTRDEDAHTHTTHNTHTHTHNIIATNQQQTATVHFLFKKV